MGRLGRLTSASLLGRARIGALAFAFLIVLIQPPQLDHDAPGHLLAAGAIALAGLLVLAVVTFVRGRPLPADAAVSAVLLVVAGASLIDPMGVVALTMCPLVALSWYGSTRAALTRILLISLAVPLTVQVSPRRNVPGSSVPAEATLIGAVLTMALVGLLIRGVYLLLRQQERAAGRNAVLAATGHRLLNCLELADAQALIWQTALDLQSFTPGIGVLSARLDGDAYVVDADAGLSEPALNARLPRAAFAELDTNPDRGGSDPIRLSLDGSRRWRAFRAGTRRILLVGATRGIPTDLTDAFATLGTQAELAERNCTAHAELVQQARHDQLTMLPNRGALFTRLASLVDAAQSGATDPDFLDVLMVIDLDDFKEVNDTYGHAAGDELLVAIAARLTAAAGGTGLAARFGGDEFALLLTGIADSDGVTRLAEQICRDLRTPVAIGPSVFTVGASVGLVNVTSEMTAGDHMRCADIAMYAAKAGGKNRVERFDPDVHGKVATVSMMEHHLAHAITNGEITVEYQPQVDLSTDVCTGVDTLPYWDHPVLGRIEPGTFLPLAERTGLIVDLGAYILRTACRQGAELIEVPGCADLRITTRIVGRQLLDPDLPALVADALSAAGLAGQRLTLEVPAEHLTDDDIGTRLRRLSDTGVRIAVHGFGNGPLTALCALPLDQFSFRTDLPDDADPGTELELLAAAGRILNLQTNAMDIDTPEQHDTLRGAGISTGQGILFAAPMAAEALTGWLARRPEPRTAGTAIADHSFA